jgi:hypothetical protein
VVYRQNINKKHKSLNVKLIFIVDKKKQNLIGAAITIIGLNKPIIVCICPHCGGFAPIKALRNLSN